MAGVKISQLQDGGALQSTDAFPVARGSLTRKILGAQLLDPLQSLDTRLNALSANTIFVVDSSTIDLSYNSSTRTLSADLMPSVSLVPTGAVIIFPSTIAPTGWLALSGQTLSRSTYSNLWTFAQSSGNIVTEAQWTSLSAYGAFTTGDLSTTFRIPDLRGRFIRSFGTQSTSVSSAAFGVNQNDEFKSHTHSLSLTDNGDGAVGGDAYASIYVANNPPYGKVIGNTGGTETRPKNIALLYCIKT
jgi:microcystin-dependent protein